MINEVIRLQKTSKTQWGKSIGFDAGALYFSVLQFESIEGLRNKCNESTKRTSQKVPLNDIQKITFNDQSEIIRLYYKNKKGKNKTLYIEGFTGGLYANFAKELAKTANLIALEQGENKRVEFGVDYLRIGATIAFTTVIAWIANGPRTGRRSNLHRLAQDIGPIGISIVGGLVLLIILYTMYKKTKNPANQQTYTR